MPVSFISGQQVTLASGATYDAAVGNNRVILFSVSGEINNFVTSPNGVTYGGQQMTRIIDAALPGNQLWAHVFLIGEAGIQAAVGNVIVEDWPGGTPDGGASARYICTAQGVNQVTPINTAQIKSSSGGSTAPGTILAGDNSLVIEYVGGGTAAATWQWVDYTERFAFPLSGYSAAVSTRQVTTGGLIGEEYNVSTANRSYLVAISLNEVSDDPTIISVGFDNIVELGEVGVAVSGVNFGAVEGTLVISPTSSMTDSRAFTVTDITAWLDTSIIFDLPESTNLKYGPLFAFVVDSSSLGSSGFAFTLATDDAHVSSTIEGVSQNGIYKNTLAIEFSADIVEHDVVSDGGGSVSVLLSGISEVTYSAEPPGADFFIFRIFDDSEYAWSNFATANFDNASRLASINSVLDDAVSSIVVTVSGGTAPPDPTPDPTSGTTIKSLEASAYLVQQNDLIPSVNNAGSVGRSITPQQIVDASNPAGLVLSVDPGALGSGKMIQVDGVFFNPGAGAGTYIRNSTNTDWVFIG